jgi:hypothetical protein
MRFPCPKLTAAGAALCLAVALGVPVPSGGQSLGELARKAKAKKKSPKSKSKVWTNDSVRGLKGQGMSIVGAPPPPPPPAPATSEQQAPAAEVDPVWAELDAAQAEKEAAERYIAFLSQQIQDWEAQLANQTDPELQDTFSVSIDGNQQEIALQEEALMEINARIAALEQQTAGKTRPAPEPPQAPVQGEGEGEAETAAPPPPSS